MLVGVISDSHDNLEAIRSAARLFKARGVGLVVHAGDWVAPFSAKALREALGPEPRIVGVWGNNEGELLYFQRVASQFNVEILGDAGLLEIGGRRIGVYHGTSELLTKAMIKSGMFDVVVYGHTHKVDVRREGSTLVVNPGELCGYLTGRRTVALVDLERLEAEVVEI
ncbi:MAG: metallophosphoesterase [Thermoproteus sp.]